MKPMMRGIGCMILLLAASLGVCRTAQATQPKKLNIVVFLADDHGYADSTVFGSKQARTPNMERIAKAGAAFRRCASNSTPG